MRMLICPECGSAELLFDALVRGTDLDARVADVHHNTCLCEACGYDGEPAIAELAPGSSLFAPDISGHNIRIRNPLGPNRASWTWTRGEEAQAIKKVRQLIRGRRA